MSAPHPRGVFSVALTPMDADLAPGHAAFVAHAMHLLDQGCDGIVPDRLRSGTGVAARNRASRFPQIAALKLLLAERTGQPGWHRLRPPLLPLTQAEVDAVRAA